MKDEGVKVQCNGWNANTYLLELRWIRVCKRGNEGYMISS